jgi:DNA-binding NarL/FixJ family response regulator
VSRIATSGKEAIYAARVDRPDTVLMDIGLPDIDGLTAGERILAERPQTRVLALTGLEDRSLVREALESGFQGFLMKHSSLAEIIGAIIASADSQTVIPRDAARALFGTEAEQMPEEDSLMAKTLTRREREILALLAAGASAREIARQLFLSPNTVRTHIQNILTKLQVHSRLEAVAFAIRSGISRQTNGRSGLPSLI